MKLFLTIEHSLTLTPVYTFHNKPIEKFHHQRESTKRTDAPLEYNLAYPVVRHRIEDEVFSFCLLLSYFAILLIDINFINLEFGLQQKSPKKSTQQIVNIQVI